MTSRAHPVRTVTGIGARPLTTQSRSFLAPTGSICSAICSTAKPTRSGSVASLSSVTTTPPRVCSAGPPVLTIGPITPATPKLLMRLAIGRFAHPEVAVLLVVVVGRTLISATVVGLVVKWTLVGVAAVCPRIVTRLVIAVALIAVPLLTATPLVFAILESRQSSILLVAVGSSSVLAASEVVEAVQLVVVTQIGLSLLGTTPILEPLLTNVSTVVLVVTHKLATVLSPSEIIAAI